MAKKPAPMTSGNGDGTGKSTSHAINAMLQAKPVETALMIKAANDWWDSTLPIELEYQRKLGAGELMPNAAESNDIPTDARDSYDPPIHSDSDGRRFQYLSKDNYPNPNAIEGIPTLDQGNGAFKQFILEYDGPKFTPEDIASNPDLYRWTIRLVEYFTKHEELIDGNDFMSNMVDALYKWGKLTPAQCKGVLNWYRSHVKRQSERVEPEQASTQTTGLDLSEVQSGTYADPNPTANNGEGTRLKVKINNKTNSKTSDRWHGWVFVNDGAEYGNQRKYGAQRPNETYRGQIEDVLRRIAADPLAAMIAYGRLTGTCGKCGRKLEDEQSVAMGIGPVCLSKM